MSDGTKVPVSDVRVGDRLKARDGTVMTVSRIEPSFVLRPGMVAFVEDSAQKWFKMPAMADGEVELVARKEV